MEQCKIALPKMQCSMTERDTESCVIVPEIQSDKIVSEMPSSIIMPKANSSATMIDRQCNVIMTPIKNRLILPKTASSGSMTEPQILNSVPDTCITVPEMLPTTNSSFTVPESKPSVTVPGVTMLERQYNIMMSATQNSVVLPETTPSASMTGSEMWSCVTEPEPKPSVTMPDRQYNETVAATQSSITVPETTFNGPQIGTKEMTTSCNIQDDDTNEDLEEPDEAESQPANLNQTLLMSEDADMGYDVDKGMLQESSLADKEEERLPNAESIDQFDVEEKTKEDGSQSLDAICESSDVDSDNDTQEATTEVVMEQEAMEIASSLFFDLNDDSDAEDDATTNEKESSKEFSNRQENKEFAESDDEDMADPHLTLTKAKLNEQKTQSKSSTTSSTVTAAQRLIQKFQLANEASKSSGRQVTRREKKKQTAVETPRSLVRNKEKPSSVRFKPPPFEFRKAPTSSRVQKQDIKSVKSKLPAVTSGVVKNATRKRQTAQRKSTIQSVKMNANFPNQTAAIKAMAAVKNVYMQKAKKLTKGLKQNPVFRRNLSFTSKQEQKRQSLGAGKPGKTSYIGKKAKSTQKMTLHSNPATNTKNEIIDLTSPQEKKCQATKVSVKIICEKGPETTKKTPKGVIHRVEKAVQIITTKTRVDNQSNNEAVRQFSVSKFTDDDKTMSGDAANPLRVRERNIQRLKDLIRKQEQAIERIKDGDEAETCDKDGVMSSTESSTETISANNTSLPTGNNLITKIGMNSTLQNKGINIGSLQEMKGTFEKSYLTPTRLIIQGNRVTPKVSTSQEFNTISTAGSTQRDPTGSTKRDPAGSTQRDPAGLTQRDPAVSTQRNPAGSTQRDPTGSTQRDPTGLTQRDPTGSTQRDPAVSTQRDPAGSTQRDPTGSTQRDPTGLTQRDPTGSTQRDPAVSTQRDPAGSTQRDPTGSTQRDPTGLTQRDPTGSTQRDLATAKLLPALYAPVTAIVGRSQAAKSNMLPKIAGVCSLAGVRHSKPNSTAIELNFDLAKNKNSISNISSPRQGFFTSTAATATNIQIEDGNDDILDVNRMISSNKIARTPESSVVSSVHHPTASVNQTSSVSSINLQILGMIPALKNSLLNVSSVANVSNNFSESELFNKLLNSVVMSQESKTSAALGRPTVVTGSQLANEKTTLSVGIEQSKQSNKGYDAIKEKHCCQSTNQHNSTIKSLESAVNSLAPLEKNLAMMQPRPDGTNLVASNMDSSSCQAKPATNLEAVREKLKNAFNTKLKPPKVIVVPNTNSPKISVNQRMNSTATVTLNAGSNSKIIVKPYPIAASQTSYENHNTSVVTPNVTTASNSAATFQSQPASQEYGVQYQRVVLVQNNGKYALVPVQDPNVPGSFLIRVNSNNSTMASNIPPPVNGSAVNPQASAFPQHVIGHNIPVPVSLNHLTGQFSQMPRLAFIQPLIVPKSKEAINRTQDTGTVGYSALHEAKTTENGQDYSALNSLKGLVGHSSKSTAISGINNAAIQSMSQASMLSPTQPALRKGMPDLEMITDSGHVLKMPPENTKATSSSSVNTMWSRDNNESFDTSPYWFKKASKGKNALPENVRFTLPRHSSSEKVFHELCNQKKSNSSTGEDFYLRLGLFENQFCLENAEKKPWRFFPKYDDEDFLELIGLETTVDALKCSFPLPKENLSLVDDKKEDRKKIAQENFAIEGTNVAEQLVDTQLSAKEKSEVDITNLQSNVSLRQLSAEEKSTAELTTQPNISLKELLASEKSRAEITNPQPNIGPAGGIKRSHPDDDSWGHSKKARKEGLLNVRFNIEDSENQSANVDHAVKMAKNQPKSLIKINVAGKLILRDAYVYVRDIFRP